LYSFSTKYYTAIRTARSRDKSKEKADWDAMTPEEREADRRTGSPFADHMTFYSPKVKTHDVKFSSHRLTFGSSERIVDCVSKRVYQFKCPANATHEGMPFCCGGGSVVIGAVSSMGHTIRFDENSRKALGSGCQQHGKSRIMLLKVDNNHTCLSWARLEQFIQETKNPFNAQNILDAILRAKSDTTREHNYMDPKEAISETVFPSDSVQAW
jgi:hypothetical protein